MAPDATPDACRIRPCDPADEARIHAIINAAATAYRGVIPQDCWHEPYMTQAHLRAELEAGVHFWGAEHDRALVAVMGVQQSGNATLIRHAYTLPAAQGRGIGGELLGHLKHHARAPLLVGTWEAASWAIAFYARHGFARLQRSQAAALLRTYWTVSARQIETSVVLALDGVTPLMDAT